MTAEQIQALIERGDELAERLRRLAFGLLSPHSKADTYALIDEWRKVAHPAPYDDTDPIASRRSDAV